jgi:outer membrane receptor for ferrienterochelin and colicins
MSRWKWALLTLLAHAVIALASVALTPLVARADGAADEADLQFELGIKAFREDKDYLAALEHFLASNRLVPNRNVVFNVAESYKALGRYAEAHRYYVDALEGETDPQIVAQLEARLAEIAPRVAVVKVTTTPPGATIYLDRKDLGSRGRAPRPLAVAEGTYRVLVELDGYEPRMSDPVTLALGTETALDLKLERIVGQVKVGVRGGKHAEVRVGDEEAPIACVAPCTLDLAPGTHLLFFTAEGYQAPPRQVAVKADQTVTTTARLTALAGSVVVETDEEGAVVEIDGQAMGFTPTVVQNVAVGRRKVRISLRGFRPYERTITVAHNQQTRLLDVQLRPIREVQAVSRVAEDVDLAPSSLTIIDGQELAAFGYPTLASALRGVRGVYLSDDHTYESAGIRGIGEPNDYGNRVLVLHDGLSLNDDLLNSSYIGSDGRVDLHDIERIEIVRGPGSLLYGTGAFSGVINMVPRARDAGSQVLASAGTYANGVARGRGGFHLDFSDDAGVWATASGAYSDGLDLPVTLIDPAGGPAVQDAVGTDKFRAVGTRGRAWWGPLNAQWLYHERKQFIPVGALGAAFNDPRTFYQDQRFAGEVRYEPSWDVVDVSARAHANHYHFNGRYASPPPDTHLVEDYYGSWFGIEARARVKLIDEFHFTVGAEGQFHPVVLLEGTEADDTFTAIPDTQYLDEDRPFNFGAGYALVEVNPVEWFRANAGARIDVYSTFGPIVVPRGALIFRPTPGGVLKIMGGRAFRAPSIYEQYYNDGGFSQAAAVDDARGLTIDPESIVSGEVEYLQRFLEDWVALGAVHASYIEDIITTVEDAPDSEAIRYTNGDSPALTLGGEVELRREFRQGWMASAFYGYQHARFLDHPDPAIEDEPRLINAPEHLAGIKAVIPIVSDIASIGMRGTLEAPRRIDFATTDTTDTAIIADATLSGHARRFGIHYVIGVYNVFDWQHELPVTDTFASRTLPQSGRTFLLEVSLAYP